jgi:hypothetical protein
MDDAGRRAIASYVAEWTLDAIPDFLKKAADGKSLSPPPSPHADTTEQWMHYGEEWVRCAGQRQNRADRDAALAEEMLAEELGLSPHQPAMPGHAELETFRSKIGCLCSKFALSPPFQLRALAAGWAADGIPLAHCLRTIEAYLTAHAAKCHSGCENGL